jgi:hypothetical protein
MDFFKALKAAAPEHYQRACFSCGRGGRPDEEENWEVHLPKADAMTDQEKGPRIEGVGLLPHPLIVVVCRNCGFVRMHTLNELSQASD